MAELVDPPTQTQQITPESGLRYDRVFFTREEIEGEIPAGPSWQRYSDLVMEVTASPDPGIEPVWGIGGPDPEFFGKGLEENELTVLYALQKAVVAADGDVNDASADALLRDLAAQAPNTHSFYARMSNPSPGPDDATDVSGQRMYLIGQGGRADVSMEPDAEDEEPLPVEMTYMMEKLRTYHIWQPAASTLLCVQSTSTDDTAIDVTIEGDRSVPEEETLTLDGTNLVSTSAEFTEIDAVHLASETQGDITVHINDGDATTPAAGDQLMVIHGANYYAEGGGGLEGDLGVPALGTDGSFEAEIGAEFEDILDPQFDFQFDDPTAPEPEIFNITMETDNGIDQYPRGGTTRPGIVEENRNIEISLNVVGERASHDLLHDAYSKRAIDLGWTLRYSDFTFPAAECIDPPELAIESEQAYVEVEGVYQSRGIQISNIQ
jgi:hypothetical protein